MNDSIEQKLPILSDARIDYYFQKYKGFAIQGLLLTVVNATIFMTITVHRILRERKEFIIIRGKL